MIKPDPSGEFASAAAALTDQIAALKAEVLSDARQLKHRFAELATRKDDPGLDNLADYLSFRHHDIRPMQRRLMVLGLSSLGRAESRVMASFDAVIGALSALAGRSATPGPSQDAFFAGEHRLTVATDRLFGPPLGHRRGRIMVTLDAGAAGADDYYDGLVKAGMDIARINCAHDDADTWIAMANAVRAAAGTASREVSILMDIAGPKLRAAKIRYNAGNKLEAGDTFVLVDAGTTRHVGKGDEGPVVMLSIGGIVGRLRIGDRVNYDDSKIEGAIDRLDGSSAVVRVTRTRTGGVRLKKEKGLIFPDTVLGLGALTDKDVGDLATVAAQADMLGYSFITSPEDIDHLEDALTPHEQDGKRLGLIAKIEQSAAVTALPDLIARAVRHRPFGVMIARGDLASAIGFERVAEMQDEILWLCEAAGVPAIWATQVLEGLVKGGVPVRGEMTDAAMAARAECVMLNKGPHMREGIKVLDRLLGRMDAHMFKKTALLRELKSWPTANSL